MRQGELPDVPRILLEFAADNFPGQYQVAEEAGDDQDWEESLLCVGETA